MKIRSGAPLVALGLLGCSSMMEEFTGRRSEEHPAVGPSFESRPFAPPTPTDTRAVQTALTAPPPISGGTLLVTKDGTLVVAADPDRDRVSIVSSGCCTRSLCCRGTSRGASSRTGVTGCT